MQAVHSSLWQTRTWAKGMARGMATIRFLQLLVVICAFSTVRSEEALSNSVASILKPIEGSNRDTAEQADLGEASDLASDDQLNVGEVQQVQAPPAPPPGPAPSDLTSALMEENQRQAQEKERLANRAKMNMKSPGCRPQTEGQLRNYGAFRTNCSLQTAVLCASPTAGGCATADRTQILVNISEVQIRKIDDSKEQLTVGLTLGLQWDDKALTAEDPQSIDLLWQAQNEFDFNKLIKKRAVGNPMIVASMNTITYSQKYELTLQNDFSFKKFPFDTHQLTVELVAPSLAQNVEILQLAGSTVQAKNHDSGFEMPFSGQKVKLVSSGSAQGPNGAWGSTQTVRITIQAKRHWWKPAVGSVLPILLAPFVAYTGFFISSEQVLPRITLASVALLSLLIMYMPAADGAVAFSLDTWISWFSFLQAMCIGVCLFVLSASSVLASQDYTEKAKALDVSFRFTFPIISGMATFAAYTIIWWDEAISIPVNGAMFVASMLMVLVAYHVASGKSQIGVVDNKDFPGI